jgi:HAD superfamily hydrolase (TIGR01509 family)
MAPALPEAVVFDFDGLILDTESSAFASVAEVYREHGVELDLAAWQAIIGTFDHPHWADVLGDRLGRPIERAAWIAHRDRRKLELLAPEVVRPGVVDLLDAAEASGVALAIASSSPEEWVVPHLERLGLRDRFAHVATRSDVDGDPRRTKPAPDIYQLAVRAIGTAPARSVALEDSLNGLIAAQAAGLRCVAVPGPVTVGLDFTAADLVVDSLADVSLDRLAALVAPEAR